MNLTSNYKGMCFDEIMLGVDSVTGFSASPTILGRRLCITGGDAVNNRGCALASDHLTHVKIKDVLTGTITRVSRELSRIEQAK